jgi:hypothetical protein
MRQAVRALGWTINILWIIIIIFTGTAIYSALNLRISLGQPELFSSDALVMLSFPLSINNTSYYDISELNSTIDVIDYNGSVILTSATMVPLIPHGNNIETAHNVSANLNDLAQRAPGYLFNDTIFDVNISTKFRYAHAFAFQFLHNTTIDWGAPLYNFSLGQISYESYNLTHREAVIPLSFENHSPFLSMTGQIRLQIFNDMNDSIGSGAINVDVPPYSSYEGQIEALIDLSELTESGALHFYFETPMFSFGPQVISYG